MRIFKTFFVGAALACLVACGGGTDVSGPSTVNQPEQPVASAPQPQPTAQPVAEPQPEHDASVKGGFYSVTNTTGIRQFYCAAAFGVLPGGDQSASTNIYQDQGVREPKDVFSGQAPKSASCQYERIQVDLTQAQDCKDFKWTNVLAAEVYANPAFIDGAKKTKLEALAYGEWTEYGPWSGEACGTRTKTRKVYEQYKYECSGEVVKVEIRTETDTETKECCKYPTPSYTISIDNPVYTPAKAKVPAVYKTDIVRYYTFSEVPNDGDSTSTSEKSAYCFSIGGQWADWGSANSGNDPACKTINQELSDFNHSGDNDLDVSLQDTDEVNTLVTPEIPAVPEALGPITTTATFSGAGTWLLRLNATGYTDGQKGQESATLTCNSEPRTLSVTYNWLNHPSEEWWGNLRLNGGVVATSATRSNPSN